VKVQYLDQTADLTAMDNEQRINEINRIFSTLFANDEIVQEVVIDGLIFREAYEPYIFQNVEQIRHIELKTTNSQLFVAEMVKEVQDYLPRLNRAISSISELFYGEMTQEGWGFFSQLVEGMQSMVQSLQIIRSQWERAGLHASIMPELAEMEERFKALLLELGETIEREEHVAAGDLLKYELGELFQHFEQLLASRVTQ
jgi:hypothetical protein